MGPLQEQLQERLFWAEHHAKDLTIAEHNRKWFAVQAVELRAAIAKANESAA